jgi:hypothetical protein
VVQFDAGQTDDRMNITVGETPATVEDARLLSVFFRAPGVRSCTPGVLLPEISVFCPLSKTSEADTGLRSGIAKPYQWHNYAARFNLPAKRITVWIDRQCRGTIDLAKMGKDIGEAVADLPWTNRYVTVGGFSGTDDGQIWTDNFLIGSPREAADPVSTRHEASVPIPQEKR